MAFVNMLDTGRSISALQRTITMAVIAAFAIGVLLIVFDYCKVLAKRRKLPPGPFPLPVVGNHLMLPTFRPWETYEKWSQYYNSPMVTLWQGSRPAIVVNDAWVASDLFEKRAHNYSTRARLVASEVMGIADVNQVGQRYGDRWRIHRRLTHTAVGSSAVRHYQSFQGDESKIMSLEILEHPEDYVLRIERYSCSIASIIGWGRRISRKDDAILQMALSIMEGVNFVIPGNTWIESLPFLVKLPNVIFKLPSQLAAAGKIFSHFFFALSEEALNAPSKCFSHRLFQAQDEFNLSKEEIAQLVANLIGGGVDTTSSSVISAILALCVFPDAQRKAHEELERVVGHERSPTWDDRDNLPYMQALVLEALRWRTVTVLAGVPHAPREDDIYNGYHIPAFTPVIGNMWAIHRHPREFPDPDVFRPERYLGGLHFNYPNTKGHNAFGWGKRQCSGQPLAEQSLFAVIARLVWAFNIQPGLDENGQEVKLDIFDYNNSENIRPEPFKARFTPRPHVEAIIREEAAEAAKRLAVYDFDTKLRLEDSTKWMDQKQ